MAADVVIAPDAETVKLLTLVRLPIARAVEPLLSVTLLIASVADEPETASEPTAFVPPRLSVEVRLGVAVASVADRLLAVIEPPVSLIT